MKRLTFLACLMTLSWISTLSVQGAETNCSEQDRADGECIIVLARSQFGLSSLLEADGALVCYLVGADSERIVEDFYRNNQMSYQPVQFSNLDDLIFNVDQGQCDLFAIGSDDVDSLPQKISDPERFEIIAEIADN